jgi:hypothetical protein
MLAFWTVLTYIYSRYGMGDFKVKITGFLYK